MTHDPYRANRRPLAPALVDSWSTDRVSVIAVVDRYPPFVNAGAEWMLHAMLRHLVRQGHTATVATNVRRPAIVDGVNVRPEAEAYPLARQADVIVGHLLWTPKAIDVAGRRRLPLVYLLHNDAQVGHWALRPSDVTAVVYNSEWLERAYQSWGGPGVIVRPPCLVDDYRVDRAGAEMVTLVNPIPDKGSDLFWELARRHPGRRFLAVGGAYGPQRRPSRKDPANIVRQASTGRMADDVYSRTRVLLAPSRFESWGRVAVEAMCSGIPVIAHPTAGLSEALGPAGIFVDRDDVRGWESALERLDDPAEYTAASRLASARALELDRIAQTDLQVWELLVLRCAASRTPTEVSI